MKQKVVWRENLWHSFLVLLCIAVDQLSKKWARTRLAAAAIEVWKDVFSFRLVYNTGGAWGIFHKHTWALTLFSVIVMIAIIVFYLKLPRGKRMRPIRLSIVFITAGALGNMIDRIVFGKVTDMFSFDLISFPVFNVADICIVCGCILTCVLLVFYYKDEDFSKWKKSNS